MAHIEPLLVTMTVRNYLPFWWCFKRVNLWDRLVIRNYNHEDAHQIAKEFFLEHGNYTHFIFMTEDTTPTITHVSQIIDDVAKLEEEYGEVVVAGYSNIDFAHDDVNISFRNMANLVVSGREVYKHPKIDDIIAGKHGWPLVRVWFQGNTLACYPRSVVEKLSFKPYRRHRETDTERYFGYKGRHGMMFDFQMCKELYQLGIPIFVDLRVVLMHFKTRLGTFKFATRPRFVKLVRAFDNKVVTIREDPPYAEEEKKAPEPIEDRRRWFEEKFLGIKRR